METEIERGRYQVVSNRERQFLPKNSGKEISLCFRMGEAFWRIGGDSDLNFSGETSTLKLCQSD